MSVSENKKLPAYLALAAVCSAIYFRCLFFGITNADDEVMITGNIPFLRDIGNALYVFTTDAFYLPKEIDLYRPLQSLSYILDAQWGGDVVFFAHLTNLLLHIICCLVVYRLLLRLEFRQPLAFTGALIYSVHYLFMTAVAWIPARGDLLLALFSLLAFLTLIQSLERPTWRPILAHLLCFTLALFSKESGIVLPLLFGIYCWSHDRIRSLGRKHLVLPPYYLLAGTLYWLLKSAAVADSSAERGFVQFVRNLRLLPEMVAKFYLPVNMSTLPSYQLTATLCGLLIMCALLALYITCPRLRQRQVLFFLAWFLLFILPGMTYYPNFYSFCNEHVDHRSYLVCFGLLLINLQIMQQFELDRLRFFKVALFALLCYLAIFNVSLSRSYRNPEAFALKAIKMGSNSALAYANYGTEKFLQGDELEALRYLNQSLRIVRKFMPALHYRARIYANRSMYREAVTDLDTILSVDPGYDPADYGLRGVLKAELKDYDGADQDLRTALRLAPGLIDARVALGRLLLAKGRVAEACEAWQMAAGQGSRPAADLTREYCRK
jgi:tetratricopeptide (TPR) repeat protein